MKDWNKKNRKERDKARRNHTALSAIQRTGAGKHGDKRKDNSRKACRGKVK